MSNLTYSEGSSRTESEDFDLPEIYYSGNAYALEHEGIYIPLKSSSDVSAHLRSAGFEQADTIEILCDIRTRNYVTYIGPVAGHPPGVYISPDSGKKFLVTDGPLLIQGKPGAFPFIAAYLRELFGPDPMQIEAATAWVRQARENVVLKKRRPLAAGVLVGPRGCGKTLFIEMVRHLIGGRSASAYKALNGGTNFNADILGAELLLIDDEQAGREYRTRMALAQGIKKHLFASSVRIEGKHRDAITMRPIQALLIAVNSEPEHLEVLPTIDDSTKDKLSLFHCCHASLGGLERDEIWEQVTKEAPHFIHYLETSQHPEGLRDRRTGAAAWQNPIVLEILGDISLEEQFRELLTQCSDITHMIEEAGAWDGTAMELETSLRDDPKTKLGADRLIKHGKAVGGFLGKLQAAGRIDVTRRTVNGITRWRIASLSQDQGGKVDHL